MDNNNKYAAKVWYSKWSNITDLKWNPKLTADIFIDWIPIKQENLEIFQEALYIT